jgi:hypothetical protein
MQAPTVPAPCDTIALRSILYDNEIHAGIGEPPGIGTTFNPTIVCKQGICVATTGFNQLFHNHQLFHHQNFYFEPAFGFLRFCLSPILPGEQ